MLNHPLAKKNLFHLHLPILPLLKKEKKTRKRKQTKIKLK